MKLVKIYLHITIWPFPLFFHAFFKCLGSHWQSQILYVRFYDLLNWKVSLKKKMYISTTFIDIFAASLNCQYFQKTKSNFKQND